MKFDIKEKFNYFLNNPKDYPLLVGFFSGFYPMVFYYSNNFESIDSLPHLAFFSLFFLVIPTLATYFLYQLFSYFNKLKPYRKQLLFVIIIEVTAVFMSQVYYLTIKKKLLLLLLIFLVFLSFKFYDAYKKIIVFILLLSLIPFVKCVNIIVYKQFHNTLSWMKQKDAIEKIKFEKKPNIYFLEPDGYASKEAMQSAPYNYKDSLYDWLESNSFILYKNSRSNYPASLASNASMFAMKHHFLTKKSSSPFEMQDARSIIVGNNPVISILKNNNYKTYFIVGDGYFQQSFPNVNYDYHNIQNYEIPFFSNDKNAQKEVYEDLKSAMERDFEDGRPKFFFVEKLLPHHVIFDGSSAKNLRNIYIKRVEEASVWLKKTIALIVKKDPSGIIIIAADHGGWVGFENADELFAAKDENLINSIFGNLLAIKWNDTTHLKYDEKLKSNVNIFRVLFSYLSENKALLQHLEEDSSFNVQQEGLIF